MGAETVIDDFLHLNGIEHSKEVEYPHHPELNPTRLRADWLLEDGTYVEAFGMAGVASYREKMTRKNALAAALGLRLISIEPTDLRDLPEIFVNSMHA